MQLLDSVRVLDLSDGDADLVTRFLADLGAEVVKVESTTGGTARASLPAVAGVSVAFLLANVNKHVVRLNPEIDADRDRFAQLASGADILVDSGIPGGTAAFGTSCEALADRYPQLVSMSVTDFGTTGPHASWRASDAVLYAMSGVLSRSGPPVGPPVLPPHGIASAAAAAQAAWAVLAAFYHRRSSGLGDYIDFSRYEAVLQTLDPPFGAQGQAAAARKVNATRRGRPKSQDSYPIFSCQDGWVRICVLAPRQWRGLRAWLGEPEEFQDPKYDGIGARFAAFDQIGALIAETFATHTVDELVTTGTEFGVPVAAVSTPAEALASAHFRATSALTDIEPAPGVTLSVPNGCVVVDGARAGVRWIPASATVPPNWPARAELPPLPLGSETGRPFSGLRVLDLGVIVAGGELARLFSDLGAEVIKIESVAYPDGLRQTRPGQAISESFAWTHRNQYSLGLDLRNPIGAQLFGRLVAESDIVFANFKPGTLAALGFSYQQLQELNPRIVLAESSAYGDNGPWSTRMGYGPLVRASTGITGLWAAETGGASRHPFWDTTTVFPDHVVARITAIATVSALLRRAATGTGAHIHVSQAEVAVDQLGAIYTVEAARAAGLAVTKSPSISGIFPCRGDDEWCVITITDESDRHALAKLIGTDLADDELVATVSRWTRDYDQNTVADLLQGAGIPAGPMNRAADVLTDPQVVLRNLYTDMIHPLLDNPLPTETAPALFRHIRPAQLRPAPMPGEHTRELIERILGLEVSDIEQLIVDGALSAPPAPSKHATESS